MRAAPVGVAALVGAMALLTLGAPAAAAAPDVTITLVPGEEPRIEASLVNVRVTQEVPTRLVEFNLTTPRERVVVHLVSEGYFFVNRARQVVPEVDDRFFFETSRADVEDPESGGRLVNATADGGRVDLRLSFFVEGAATLRFTRDVRAPTFTLGDPTEVQPYSFLFRTTTNEYALANLLYWPTEGGETIPLPTTVFALEQTFPVQGLRADTEYGFRVEFEDWAKNRAVSGNRTVRTPPLPHVEGPLVLRTAPEDGARFPAGQPPARLEANFSTPVGVIDPEAHVRLFVDKREVSGDALRTATFLLYAPEEPFADGYHSVGLELANSEGGRTVALWDFVVGEVAAPPGTPGPGAPAVLLVLLGLAFALAGRRRGPA